MDKITLITISAVIIGILLLVWSSRSKKKQIREKLDQKFPELWLNILKEKVMFYNKLNEADKRLFEKRTQLFIATKSIEGVETEIDDSVRLMVAASAIIPTFAFPDYNYPYVHSVLIYPGTFDRKYQTHDQRDKSESILGMVSGGFQNGTVIFSKPDLVKAFDGLPHKENVGIHEFVHLLDKDDGDIDGIPELIIQHAFIGPWLKEIKQEIKRIEKGNSDINPYALTNNAEFLAVVSEYFFENPEKFQRKHPELYSFLATIFRQQTPAHNNPTT
jgi:Mlc titration factor MtfA (ptsG expression regulator)